MNTKFDSETGVKTWLLDRWYQKVAYCIGIFVTVVYAAMFFLGILAILAEL